MGTSGKIELQLKPILVVNGMGRVLFQTKYESNAQSAESRTNAGGHNNCSLLGINITTSV